MEASDGRPGSSARNRELDWLRAYAILFVLAEHATMITPSPTGWSRIVHVWYEGRTGVDLFYVISGFVIAGTFLPAFDAAIARGRRDVAPSDALRLAAAFYLKRLVRLWPAAAAWSALTLGAAVAFAGLDAFPAPAVCLRKFVAALLYGFNWSELVEPTNIGYLYSLATEMQFYAAFPLVMLVVRTDGLRCLLAAAVFLLGFGGCFGLDARPQLRFGGIVAGVALFLLLRRVRSPDPARPAAPARPAGAAAFTVSALVALATCELPSSLSSAAGSHVAALIGCLLVGAASLRRRCVSPLGLPNLLDWLGSRSYSLYLCHIPAMLICRCLLYAYAGEAGATVAAPLLPQPIPLAVSACAVILFTELTYRLLERPCLAGARTVAASLLSPSGWAAVSPVAG